MTPEVATTLVATATYAVMVIAYFNASRRAFHVPVMISIMVFDLLMPFYLYLDRDLYKRLILNQDILTFGVWMHFMLLVVLYMLYFFQVQTAVNIWRGQDATAARAEHRAQGKGVLLVRAFVIITGAMLIAPTQAPT